MKLLKYLFLLLALAQIIACQSKTEWKTEAFKTETGWGYTIRQGPKVYIKQSIIPVLSHEKSFSSKDDALRTANFVLEKIKNSKNPSLTEKDLKFLKII